MGFPGGSAGKESPFNVGDLGSIPGLGGFPGEGNSYPLQCSALENSINCIVHEILQARILEWVAVPFSRESSQSRNRTQVSLHCRRILYQLSHQGSPRIMFKKTFTGAGPTSVSQSHKSHAAKGSSCFFFLLKLLTQSTLPEYVAHTL